MEVDEPLGLWLRVNGCLNGDVWVDVEFPANGQWKSFARTRYLVEGHFLHYKLVESDALSGKFIRPLGARLGCCTGSLCDSESSSSSDND